MFNIKYIIIIKCKKTVTVNVQKQHFYQISAIIGFSLQHSYVSIGERRSYVLAENRKKTIRDSKKCINMLPVGKNT